MDEPDSWVDEIRPPLVKTGGGFLDEADCFDGILLYPVISSISINWGG